MDKRPRASMSTRYETGGISMITTRLRKDEILRCVLNAHPEISRPGGKIVSVDFIEEEDDEEEETCLEIIWQKIDLKEEASP